MEPRIGQSLFERVGGRAVLERVHRYLYDEVYGDPVLGNFFRGIDRTTQERQLTDFMSGAMGGPAAYVGRHPRDAHRHVFITADAFDRRHRFLTEALHRAGVAPGPASEWLRLDQAFRRTLVKQTLNDCHPQFVGERILTAGPSPR